MTSSSKEGERRRRYDSLVAVFYQDMYRYAAWLSRDKAPNDELDDLREAIFELDDDYREPLVLQVLMGYSTSEIAEMMGLKQGAVLTRLHRARHKLKDSVVKH
jgi:DNA-directed RNA polymerase specialized sigma24 family protein